MILFTESFGLQGTADDVDAYILGRWSTWTPYGLPAGPTPTDPAPYLSIAGPNGQVVFLKILGGESFRQGGLGIVVPVSLGQTSLVIGGYFRARENVFATKGIIDMVATVPIQNIKSQVDHTLSPSEFMTTATCSLVATPGYGLMLNLSGGAVYNSGSGFFPWGWGILSAPPLPAGIIQQDKWHFIEVKFDWGGAAVTGSVHLDGIEVLPPTEAVDGQGLPLGMIAPTQMNVSFNGIDFTGIYILDDLPSQSDSTAATDFIGEVTILSLPPIADGTHLDWTPDVGTTHYTRVTPPADGDGSFVYTDLPGSFDAYKFQMSPGGPKTIYQVAVNNVTRQRGAGVRQIAGACASGSAVATGIPGASLATHYTPNTASFDVDPATGAPWTETGIADAEFGIVLAT